MIVIHLTSTNPRGFYKTGGKSKFISAGAMPRPSAEDSDLVLKNREGAERPRAGLQESPGLG